MATAMRVMLETPVGAVDGITPNRAPGFVDVRATALRAGIVDSQGNRIVAIRRGPAKVWTVRVPYLAIDDAVIVSWEREDRGRLEVGEARLHPTGIWWGIRGSSV